MIICFGEENDRGGKQKERKKGSGREEEMYCTLREVWCWYSGGQWGISLCLFTSLSFSFTPWLSAFQCCVSM